MTGSGFIGAASTSCGVKQGLRLGLQVQDLPPASGSVTAFARYGVMMQFSPWNPPLTSVKELKVLVRKRETLLQTLTQERSRLHALQHKARSMTTVVALVQERIDLLLEQINTLER